MKYIAKTLVKQKINLFLTNKKKPFLSLKKKALPGRVLSVYLMKKLLVLRPLISLKLLKN